MLTAAAFAKTTTLPEEQGAFFDDIHRMFLGLGRGEVGKYMYDNPTSEQNNVWADIVGTKSNYYIPEAERTLLKEAKSSIIDALPKRTAYIDFGAGCETSFKRNAMPLMQSIGTTDYYGVDFDQKILDQISMSDNQPDGITIHPTRMDFFIPTYKVISPAPALGVMNGITLTNMYGSLYENDIGANLVRSLKYLHQLTNNGWLLLSVDTNQDAQSLLDMYLTPLNSKLNVSSLPRMEAQLPVSGFDSSLFDYDPEWFPEKQLLAHQATATEDQDFSLGGHELQVRKGDKLHLFNSYKFKQPFFETCCSLANLNIQGSWKHDSGVMLYLLKG